MFVTPAHVAFVRGRAARKTPWTLPELEASLPRAMTNSAEWRLSASHNNEAAANAGGTVPGARWDTAGTPQQPGMWFQIELPEPAAVTEVQIDTAVPFSFGRGRGAGGRGGPAAAQRGAGAGRGGRQVPIAGPVAYSVQLSMDGTSWGSPVAQGAGAPTTVVQFAPSEAKFIRISQTGNAVGNEQWAIAQIRVYQAAR
jgi:hypothetical protein